MTKPPIPLGPFTGWVGINFGSFYLFLTWATHYIDGFAETGTRDIPPAVASVSVEIVELPGFILPDATAPPAETKGKKPIPFTDELLKPFHVLISGSGQTTQSPTNSFAVNLASAVGQVEIYKAPKGFKYKPGIDITGLDFTLVAGDFVGSDNDFSVIGFPAGFGTFPFKRTFRVDPTASPQTVR